MGDISRMKIIHANAKRLQKEQNISKSEALNIILTQKAYRKCPAGRHVEISIEEENKLYLARITYESNKLIDFSTFFNGKLCRKICSLCL